ncbi:MAG: hypothetical protein ABII79_09345 [bacterium]
MNVVLAFCMTSVVLCMSIAGSARGQDFALDIARVSELLQESDSLYVTFEVEVYGGADGSQLVLIQKASYCKHYQTVLYSLGPVTMFCTEGASLVINHSAKTMLLSHIDTRTAPPASPVDQISARLDSILGEGVRIEYLGHSEGAKRYRLRNSEGPIRVADIVIDSSTSSIKSLRYQYDQSIAGFPMTAAVLFSYPDNPYIFGSPALKLQHYVTTEGDSAYISQRFADYELSCVEDNND